MAKQQASDASSDASIVEGTEEQSSARGKVQKTEKVDPFKRGGSRSGTPAGNRPKTDAFGAISRDGYLGQRDDSEGDPGSSKYRVIDIEVDRVLDSPFQARDDRSKWNDKQKKKFDQLRQSIREDGLNDIFFVAPHPDQEKAEDGFYILAYGGHNRRDAARLEGHTHLPCIVVDYNHEKVGFGTTRENEVRIDLDALEKGRQYTLLMSEFHLTRDDLARKLDISPDVIKNCIMVFQCPGFIQEFVRELGDGGFRLARDFKKMWDRLRESVITDKDTEDEQAQKESEIKGLITKLMNGYKSGEMKVERIETEIERILEQAKQPGSGTSTSSHNLGESGIDTTTSTLQDRNSTSIAEVSTMSEGEVKLVSIIKAFHRWQRMKGDDSPTHAECKLLDQLIQEAKTNREEAE